MNSALLDETLRAGVARDAAAGAVAAVVDEGGVSWIGATGLRAMGEPAPMNVDTVFALHSMTKAVVSIAALRLVDEGRLDLDEPAATWCPWLAEAQVFESPSSLTDLRAPTNPITLRHLLTHTSGFTYAVWNEQLGRWIEATGHPTNLLTRMALRTPLAFDPGTAWQYGTGIDWAGLVIEAITGQTLGDHLHATILGPLGMQETTFHPGADLRDRLAGRHQRQPDGTLERMPNDPPINGDFDMGGGGLYGTVPDYCRFLHALLVPGAVDGVELLPEARMHEWVFSNQIGDLRVSPLRSTNAALSEHAEFFPGDPKGHSLVGQINLVPAETGRATGTLAWAGMANCYFWVDRTSGVAGVYASRMFPFADHGSLGLALDLERAVYSGG